MKNLKVATVLFILALTISAFSNNALLTALTPLRADLDTLWEYRFFYDDALEAVGSCEDWHAADDFQTGNATIKGFECWCIYEYGPDNNFLLSIYEDNDGHPGNSIWSAFSNDVTFTDTGYDYFHMPGAPIWHCEILLDTQDYMYLSEFDTYWLEIYQEELTYFNWLCDPYYDGNLHLDEGDGFEDIHLNAFFVVKGNWGTSVEETSWGEIKAAYE
jgi:hypothetical protein